MNTYAFQLGREQKISIAEITAFFLHENIKVISQKHINQFLIVETKKPLDANKLISRLGGTIKIGTKLECPDSIVRAIVDSLDEDKTGKVHFSISGTNAKRVALNVKNQLKERGRSVRYIEANNTATIIHNHLIKRRSDFTIINKNVFMTVGVQNIESFSVRDYDRPGSDNVSGMLPPKLARIMVNLSLATPEQIILDPFCGSGTVLTEALDLGFKNIIGSDNSGKAIDDSKKNIEWISQNYQISDINYQTLLSDATQLSKKIKLNSIDVIISEPYMGKPLRGNERLDTLQMQTAELGQLYVSAFQEFYKVLKKGGMVVFIIPQFRHHDGWVKTDCVEKIKKAGFLLESFGEDESLLYWRKKQYVGRGIYRFRKK
ncbi:MAG: hypothetical protein COX81_03390 [Candidatus Magasanikbacteria bacterium CG_4_10_14_0_2_um_filter_37_12]|uniref:Ribosomal RNA large subunit methyltransferase K/L-like methyltransferase domain-containing protein n=1 Tax=Candidatus Magasanikbacteria bacterium CG_4_10_14_0_2_um_filter_37_12 TaxID=1974637 RepID=A0A2M7V751_9BACT|nr:MAG: hypothetical protein COX81_03390 [Candidatus Magasanikbacteria bacterium CG_4_10_14_0_2_um_filter_37_12]